MTVGRVSLEHFWRSWFPSMRQSVGFSIILCPSPDSVDIGAPHTLPRVMATLKRVLDTRTRVIDTLLRVSSANGSVSSTASRPAGTPLPDRTSPSLHGRVLDAPPHPPWQVSDTLLFVLDTPQLAHATPTRVIITPQVCPPLVHVCPTLINMYSLGRTSSCLRV